MRSEILAAESRFHLFFCFIPDQRQRGRFRRKMERWCFQSTAEDGREDGLMRRLQSGVNGHSREQADGYLDMKTWFSTP